MIRWHSTTLWKVAARQMLRRPARTALTLLGIVCGVATIVAVTLTTQATRRAFHEMFATVTGRAALEVVAEGLGGFDENLAAELANVHGVEAALPVIQTAAAALGKSGPTPVLILGIDPLRDGAARDYRMDTGRALQADDSASPSGALVLEVGFARAHGFEVGRPARLWTPTGIMELPVVGLMQPRGVATFNGGAVAIMPLATAQRAFALPKQVNSVQLVLVDGTDAPRVQAELQARLSTGLQVQAPSARGERSRDALYSIEQCLAAASLLTLVAGAFVILNTLLMNLTERRRQLAIWRALGATRAQVTGLLLREAALFGCAGTLLGIGAGHGLALVTLGVMEQVVGGVHFPELRWTSEALLLAVLFGPGMALAATWLPARRAARRAPLEDLLARGGVYRDEQRRWPAVVGAGLVAAQVVGLVGLAQGWVPPTMLALIMPLGVIGVVFLIPLAIPSLLRLVAVALRWMLGFEGRLAMRQLERRPTRTSLTVGTLAIAIFISIGVGNGLNGSVRDIRDWINRVATADFYVRASQPDGAYAITMSALPEKFEAELARLDGVARVDKVNWILARAHEQRVIVLACTMPAEGPLSVDLVEGHPEQVRRGFMQGGAVVGTALAQRLKLRVGDEIVLETRRGPTPLRIVGTANEYTIDGMALYLEWHAARQHLPVEGVHVFGVSAQEGKTAVVAEELARLSRERGLLLQSQGELRRYIDQSVLAVFGMVWGILGMIFVVASLGTVNTLTMNVLEQTRELGMLRAIGLQRRQLRKLIMAQALAVGLMSLVPGTLIGLALAYVIHVFSSILLAHAWPFHLDLALIAGCLAAALAITLLAALAPARRAARLQVVQALQVE